MVEFVVIRWLRHLAPLERISLRIHGLVVGPVHVDPLQAQRIELNFLFWN